MNERNLQQEITELGILGIGTSGGVLTRSVMETAIDSHKDALKEIDLDKLALKIDNSLKAFAEDV